MSLLVPACLSSRLVGLALCKIRKKKYRKREQGCEGMQNFLTRVARCLCRTFVYFPFCLLLCSFAFAYTFPFPFANWRFPFLHATRYMPHAAAHATHFATWLLTGTECSGSVDKSVAATAAGAAAVASDVAAAAACAAVADAVAAAVAAGSAGAAAAVVVSGSARAKAVVVPLHSLLRRCDERCCLWRMLRVVVAATAAAPRRNVITVTSTLPQTIHTATPTAINKTWPKKKNTKRFA